MNDTHPSNTTARFTPFDPPRYLRNPDLQTFFGSSKIRLWRAASMKALTRDITITTSKGVRLTGEELDKIAGR